MTWEQSLIWSKVSFTIGLWCGTFALTLGPWDTDYFGGICAGFAAGIWLGQLWTPQAWNPRAKRAPKQNPRDVP